MAERIGWIGIGKMGEPMALNIVRAGHDLTVWNRSLAKCEGLRAAGARVTDDIENLASAVDVLFVSVSDDSALRAVALGATGALARMKKGSVLVEMSTVSVAISVELAQAAEARGVSYLRAPVSGSVILAAAGQLRILVSGPRGICDAVLPLLALLSAQQLYVGEGENARTLKLAINMMVGVTAAMMGEAMALCLKHGMDRETILDAIGASVAASPLIGYKIDALKARDYSPKFSTHQIAKDYDLIFDASMASHTPMPLAALVREHWNAVIAAGQGDADFFQVVEFAARAAGISDA